MWNEYRMWRVDIIDVKWIVGEWSGKGGEWVSRGYNSVAGYQSITNNISTHTIGYVYCYILYF